MSVKLLTEHHLEFLSLKVGCTGSPESTLVKMPHYWKSHIMAHIEKKHIGLIVHILLIVYIFRNWNGGLWKNLFHALLNVPSCDELPNLAELRSQFEDYFVSDLLPKYNVMSQSFMKFLDR